MELSQATSKKQILLISGLFMSTISILFFTLFIFGVEPASAVCGDGRINCDAGQTGAIYCEEDGIHVLFARSDDSRQGQEALFAPSAEIENSGIPSGNDAILLASNASAYTLHRLSDSRIQFTSPGLETGSLYTFQFYYPFCIGIGPVLLESSVGGAPGAGNLDTPTPFPTTTPPPVVLGSFSLTCGAGAGQYTLNYSGIPLASTVTYNLVTAPTVDNQNGTFPTGAGNIPFTYSGVGNFDVSGTGNFDGAPFVIPMINCP